MVWVAVAEAVALVAVVAILGRLLSSQQRAHARREDLLVNQLLNAAGKTWQEPPVEEVRRRETPPAEQRRWSAAPEQEALE